MTLVEQYYDSDDHVEWERLDRHRTEFAVTMRAFAEFLPPPPAQILDVGGGPGRYSIALATQGHQVTLVDMSSRSLERAAQHAADARVQLMDIQNANALDLSIFASQAYDAVLLLGPLYHLTTIEERTRAIHEAWRLLRPDGILFAAFLTRYSALRVCAERFPQWLAENPAYVEKILTAGVHSGEWGFTVAYYAHISEIQPLMEANGFVTLRMIGCEGIVAHAENSVNQLTGSAWEWWADLNYRLGKEKDLFGSATHLLHIGQKAL